jgi:hypothetical protein
MKKFFLCFICFYLFSFNSYGASPFEIKKENYFNENFAYTTPSLTLINFEISQFLTFHPGHFWYKNFFVNTLETRIMGTNLVFKEDQDAKPYVSTLYISYLKIGYLFEWKKFRLFAAASVGIFYTNDIKELEEINSEKETFSGGGLSGGFRWKITEKIHMDLNYGHGKTTKDTIQNIHIEISYQISKKWKIGLFSETGTRSFTICEENVNECTFEYSLTYGALYGSWNGYKDYWFVFGLGGSRLNKGLKNDTTTTKGGVSIYLSIK